MDITTGPRVEIEHAGAHITIPSATIAELWLERARMKAPEAPAGTLPKIGDVVSGATFMGLMRGENGASDYLLFDLGEAPERMKWEAAGKWAEERGGGLPTRREQSILFGNRAEDQFKQEWYWSCEQYAGGGDSAWVQTFYDGSQSYGLKGHGCRARAVRRQPIQ